MGAVQFAADRICRVMPWEILDYTYVQKDDWRNQYPKTFESIITDNVIRQRVIRDIDTAGGLQIVLPLDDYGITIEQVTLNNYVINVPLEATQGRFITSVLSVIAGTVNNYGISYNGQWGAHSANQMRRMSCGWNPASEGLRTGMDVYTPMNILSTANVTFLQPNVLLLQNVQPASFPLSLRCFLSHDPELTNIKMETYNDFAKLCTYAAQADIYRRTVIRMDRGATAQGQELGSIKDYIDRFSDSEQTYMEYFENTWMGVAAWNDPETRSRAVRIQSGYF